MARVGAPCNVMQQASGRQFAKSHSNEARCGMPRAEVWLDSSLVALRCRHRTCSRAWKGVDQVRALCVEWCGVANPDCRQCIISACVAHQISANTEQKRSLN